MVEYCRKLTQSQSFNRIILGLIFLSGILVGVETYPAFSDDTFAGQVLQTLQTLILIVFLVEIALKVMACGNRPFDYFKEPWNLFDFTIVVICFLPLHFESAAVVRMARILRALRMITVLPRLRLLVSALLRSIPSLGYIGVLLGLHFYIYSVIGTVAFGDNDPIRFGSLHKTSTTLFQVLTLEGWNDVRDTQVMGSDVTYDDAWKELAKDHRISRAQPIAATIYFVTFILLGTMIMLNLFTGVIISSMEEAQNEAGELTQEKGVEDKGFMTLHDELVLLHKQLHTMNDQILKLQQVAARESQKGN